MRCSRTNIYIVHFCSGLGHYKFISCVFPAGSRVSTELQYTREKQGEETVFTSQMLIQTPKKEGTNILTPEALLVHMEAALSASKVQVSLFGK